MLRYLAPLALLLAVVPGCSDDDSFAAIEAARLVADPSAVTFNLPADGEGSVEAQILLTNAGGATLTVQSVTVFEGDDIKEVDVVDADDWATGGTEIASGDTVPLRLQWTVRDATVDTGEITIVSTGGDASVTFQTLDIDPVLVVTSDPAGTRGADGLDVAVGDAPPGTVRPVALTLTSESIAALTLSEVCLLNALGECQAGGAVGAFSLCDGPVTTLRDCQPPDGERTLQQSDNARLTVLYRPEPGSGNTSSARVQISSNSAQTPRYTVTVRGTPCSDSELDCLGGAPTATIESPVAQRTYYEGMDIEFRGLVADGEDAADTLRVWWLTDDFTLDLPMSADVDGINEGTVQLSAGPQFISLFVEDSDGNIGVDGVAIVVEEPNEPPLAPNVVIAPNPAATGDSLTASATGAVDPEGDPVVLTWQWQRDGSDTEFTGTEVPAEATAAGQTWTAIASAADAFHPAVTGSASVTIENTPPSVDSVTIRGDAFTDGTLVCVAEVSDPDGAVNVTYSWRVNGESYDGDTLDLSETGAEPGDTITCVVLADDGGDVSQLSASITLSNRPPQVLSVTISPALILQNTLVSCAATADDADGESPSLAFAWTINGQAVGQGATLQLTEQIAPVAASLVCTVTATDAFDGTDTGFDTATVLLCDRAEARTCNPNDVQACRADGLDRVVVDECGELGCEDGECLQGCGDGILEDGEACDDGDNNSDDTPNACRTNCELPSCGDLVTDDGEACDDGNDIVTDGCIACVEAFCGDGFIQNGEETCDDGDNNSDDAPNACRTNCEPAGCGDGVVDDNEGCDDGNDINDDECDNNCDAPILDGNCTAPAVKLGGAPNGRMVVCKDESDQTCEQDFESLCPTDWHLCTMDEFNARNDGWDFPSPSNTPALGVIYCRPNGGAGHFTVPDSGGQGNNLGTDERFNCYYGSSRASCTAVYGCNEQRARALCCAPQPLCGNGQVDHAEEQCDDGNDDDSDECLSTCTWRVPTAHGFRGTNCN